jgi:integrase
MTCFQSCPRKHYYKYVLGWSKTRESDALRIGSAVHTGLDTRRTVYRYCHLYGLAYNQARKTEISKYLGEYGESLKGKARDAQHVAQTVSMIERVLTAAGVKFLGDITPARVEQAIAGLMFRGGDKRPVSVRTKNAHLIAVKALTHWLYRTNRIAEDALASLTRSNEETDRRRERRALDADEQSLLIAAAESGPDRCGISGMDRAMLYRVALGTGFRASELASLAPASFLLTGDEPAITVKAGYSKNRQAVTQPIHPDLADALGPWLRFKPKGVPIFPIKHRGGEMIAADMRRAWRLWIRQEPSKKRRAELAGSDFLRVVDAEGQIVDFHALRHTYISTVVASGASVKVAQELARHSTPFLTIKRYAHVRRFDLRRAIPGTPQASPPAPVKKNGTDK